MKFRTGVYTRLRSGRGLSQALAIAAAIRDHLKRKAIFILAVAFSGATLCAQQPAWADSFDKIRDPDHPGETAFLSKTGLETDLSGNR